MIRPTQGWTSLRLGDVWEFRELLYFLVWRDVKVRYKQTALGAAWAVLQPLLTMVDLHDLLRRARQRRLRRAAVSALLLRGTPPVDVLRARSRPGGKQPRGVRRTSSRRSISPADHPARVRPDGAGGLRRRLSCPRRADGLVRGAADHRGDLAPLLLLLAALAALGSGLWLAALNVEYRDVRYVVPFFVQLWLFVTPVIYPTSRLTAKLAEWAFPSGSAGSIRWPGSSKGSAGRSSGRARRPGPILVASAAVTLLVLVSGAFYFRRMERTFADVV